MRYFLLPACLLLLSSLSTAQERSLPVIDMHLHSYDDTNYFVAPDQHGVMAPPSAALHFEATYDIMRRRNIVLGAISNTRASEETWMEQDVEQRFLRGVGRLEREADAWTPEAFEQEVKDGKIHVLGEVLASLHGMTLADPFYRPYLRICEEYGIPVALHTGGGPPGINYRGMPEARLAQGNPLLIEDVLVEFPRLKVYLMHAGGFYYEEAARLMMQHRQVYAGLGVLLWMDAAKPYGRDFLKRAKEFGLLERVMFGSDQMVWPQGIEQSLEGLDALDFLTEEEKRNILYHNAARFLGLSEEEIEAHHRP